eukprot:m.26831 g.26831  ORF g.26831 m.26831 type:complete len:55 (-) comp5891_c0_seq1:2212-2376(-)
MLCVQLSCPTTDVSTPCSMRSFSIYIVSCTQYKMYIVQCSVVKIDVQKVPIGWT